jgi:hypothetical protein
MRRLCYRDGDRWKRRPRPECRTAAEIRRGGTRTAMTPRKSGASIRGGRVCTPIMALRDGDE